MTSAAMPDLLTGRVAEMAPWLAAHMDVNALDLAGVEDQALATELQRAAAENLKLASATDEAITRAAQTWLPPGGRGDGRIDLLIQWWSAYKVRRPHWSAALGALDRLFAD